MDNLPVTDAIVSPKGARRWAAGHPWIFRSDVMTRPATAAGVVRTLDGRGQPLGWALWSPASEISLRRLDPDPDARIDDLWWYEQLSRTLARRAGLEREASAFRLVHGEGDGLPSVVCDRYARWLVVQRMSAGLEDCRAPIVAALRELTSAEGILARN